MNNPPAWVKDLVIYELNPRGFTSPDGVGDGHGSGTFTSLGERLPYLRDLGVNGIWLAGYYEAGDYFYGIWSVYGVVDPSRIDARLGTRAEFKAFVDAAHAHGIRIFLEVTPCGVVPSSPLPQEHPEYFDGEYWGLSKYDHDNPDFRKWWVQVWTDYVTDFGVDGYRIDWSLCRIDVWDEIVRNAEAAGREIAIFGEAQPYHFGQCDSQLKTSGRHDIGAMWAEQEHRYMTMQVSCHDWGWRQGPGNYYIAKGSRALFGHQALLSHRIPLFFAGEEFNADQVSLPALERQLFGGGGPGGWLYGSQLRWDQLGDPDKAAMLADVTTMLRIRRENADLLNADHTIGGQVPVPGVPHTSLTPYMRYLPGSHAIVVVANEAGNDITYTLQLPLATAGLAGQDGYRVTDLWTGEENTLSQSELADWRITVPGDHRPGGGIRAYRVEPVDRVDTEIVDDTDPRIAYSPGFTVQRSPHHHGGTVTVAAFPGARAACEFEGTGVIWLAHTTDSGGTAAVLIDGALVTTADLASSDGGGHYQAPVFTMAGLEPGRHTIEIVTCKAGSVAVDGFVVIR